MKINSVFSRLLVVLLLKQVTNGQLLNENFDYTAGDNLTTHGWLSFSSGGTNPITVSIGGLSFTDYASSGIGNAALLDNTGEDDKKYFTEQTSGSIYASFLVNVATDGAPAGYFFSFRKSNSLKGRVFIKEVSNNLEFGLTKSGATGNYTTNSYSFGTTYLLVLKYEFKAGIGDDEVSLCVFSSGDDFSSEPGTPTLGTYTDGTDFTGIDHVALRQYTASQNITVDGIRVGTSWSDTPLPVELTSFTADNSRAGEITLNWVTESEIENLGFILERGAESEDGTTAEWTEIASYITDEALRGQGSVTYRTEYSFTDKTVEPGVTYDYRLADVSYAGEKVYHALNVLGVAVTEIPEEFALFPAYPNPFNPETVIRYQLSADSDVSLQIYDVKGQMIETLLNKTQDPGFYKVNWKPINLPSGVYFCKLTIGDRTSTQKLILLK